MRLSLASLFVFLWFSLSSQTLFQKSYSGGGWFRNVITMPDRLAIGGYIVFPNYDSGYIDLLQTDMEGNVIDHDSWKTSIPLAFLDLAVEFDGGYLFTGVGSPNFGDYHPWIFRTDIDGNVKWSKWFSNLGFASHQLNAMVVNGDDFTVYSYPDGFTEGFYRLDANDNDSTFTATSFSLGFSGTIRMWHALPFPNKETHLLSGPVFTIGQSTLVDAFLMKVNATSLLWAKQYDLDGTVQEQFYDVITTSDGGFAGVGICQDDSFHVYGFALKTDSSGNVQWGKKIHYTGGTLGMYSLVETVNGDLLLSGIAGFGTVELIKLSSNGTFLWAKTWSPSVLYGGSIGRMHRDGNSIIAGGKYSGSYMLMRLDEEGNGCEFEEAANLVITDFPPEVNSFTMSVSSFVPEVQNETISVRSYTENPIDICITGIEESKPHQTPSILANLTGEFATVIFPPEWRNTSLSLINSAGSTVMNTQVSQETITISLNEFPSGLYLFHCISGTRAWSGKIIAVK